MLGGFVCCFGWCSFDDYYSNWKSFKLHGKADKKHDDSLINSKVIIFHFYTLPQYLYCLQFIFLLQPWSENLCHAQSFCHTLANSVQVLIFPVIGIERWYSIESPFEMTKNLRRVNYLNGMSRMPYVLNECFMPAFNTKRSN